MPSYVDDYIDSITKKFSYQETSEMGYRTDFEVLLKHVFEPINVTRFDHDPKKSHGNKPDFIVMKNNIPILYIEAKDIGISLDKTEKSEQMSRYFGYANLVLTDYVEFRFYRNGIIYGEPIKIADYNLQKRAVSPLPTNYDNLLKTLVDFTKSYKEPIRSGSHLAKIMGGKALRIRDTVIHLFETNAKDDNDLVNLYETIKGLLVHDLTIHTFADMYAQTLVYGLFVARYHDKTPENFTRSEARELIPNSNKFLRRFFDHIVGVEFKNILKYIVDELCEVFSHADVGKLMEDYFKTSKGDSDPVIHFYEDFLNEYDPVLRKKMGAYYTPQPVVDFIVNSVDGILKNDFHLANGLADTSKLANGKHKVQVLDPATGTGTFISSVVGLIHETVIKNNQNGRWFAYIHNDLLPRIHGFELMMAPYTIAHLRLGIEFRKMGFWDFHRRLGIYLTNTLEESGANMLPMAFGLAESIAEESKEAALIKDKTPIMVVVGNPPYSIVSSNETKYANNLVERYKVEPGGKNKLQERKHWLNDDYVKFIAFAESMIEKTGEGIVAMITNNGYLDNPTFRGMRWHLSKTFDDIYLLNLHGNAKKKEKTPSGEKDENVFNIMQGVGIILAVKTGKKSMNAPAKVYYADLYGTRKFKFDSLANKPKWQEINPDSKMFYFIPRNNEGKDEYEKGVRIDKFFTKSSTGIFTLGDDFIIGKNKEVISERVQKIVSGEYNEATLNTEFGLGKNYAKFVMGNQAQLKYDENKVVEIAYRPFDKRWTYFDNKVIWRWRENVMRNFISNKNIGILVGRQGYVVGSMQWNLVSITDSIVDLNYYYRGGELVMPLYLYNDDGSRELNLNHDVLKGFTKNIVGGFEPEELIDYMYAVLHSPKYRDKYQEFLKNDFPVIPYPKETNSFRELSRFGKELRYLHLLESPKVNNFVTTYPESGSDAVDKVLYENGKCYINDIQYFGKIPEAVWNFYIGGYQPARKWLKDRKGSTLTNSEIEHYQKIIVSLFETEQLMNKLDNLV